MPGVTLQVPRCHPTGVLRGQGVAVVSARLLHSPCDEDRPAMVQAKSQVLPLPSESAAEPHQALVPSLYPLGMEAEQQLRRRRSLIHTSQGACLDWQQIWAWEAWQLQMPRPVTLMPVSKPCSPS